MATEGFVYLAYTQAVVEHIELMRRYEETRYGVFDRTLVESALARPQQAVVYEVADLSAQAATLCFGLIKNHLWVGGNKRTASFLTETFLEMNDWELIATDEKIIEMVLAVESDVWEVDEIEKWLRINVEKI